MKRLFRLLTFVSTTWLSAAPLLAQATYDPLNIAGSRPSIELSVRDVRRQRDIPLRVYLPQAKSLAPVVLFSHGLGGSRDNSTYLGEHLSGRGYVAVFMQHQGSDEALWKEGRLLDRARAMRAAVSVENLVLRCEDVHAVIDALQVWNEQAEHQLFQNMDLEHIGMCGHSFGAQTTQSVSGQSFPIIGQKYLEPRIDAAIAYSPSSPVTGSKSAAFEKVSIPWMLMTGTKDTAPLGNQTVQSRLEVYPFLPESIDRYELVLFDAEHLAFSDRPLGAETRQRNPNHHRIVLALSTAFWDSYLKSDAAARKWLRGEGAKQLLASQDRWQVGSQH